MGEYPKLYLDFAHFGGSGDYFEVLNKLMDDGLVKNRIIFGTDWLMTRHTWKEKAYVEAFTKLPSAILQQIALQNPLNFLFPGKKLPLRVKHFFESKNINEAQFPEWMKNNLDI